VRCNEGPAATLYRTTGGVDVLRVDLSYLHGFRCSGSGPSVPLRDAEGYLHVISVLLALVLGLMQPPAGAGGNAFYLTAGSLFFFLLVWGAGGPVLRLFGLRPARARRPGRQSGRPADHVASA
jgi:hypothetical protein